MIWKGEGKGSKEEEKVVQKSGYYWSKDWRGGRKWKRKEAKLLEGAHKKIKMTGREMKERRRELGTRRIVKDPGQPIEEKTVNKKKVKGRRRLDRSKRRCWRDTTGEWKNK